MPLRFVTPLSFVLLLGGATNVVAQEVEALPGRLWVQFSEDASPPDEDGRTGLTLFDRAADEFGVYDIQEAFPFFQPKVVSESARKLMRTYVAYFDPALDPEDAALALARDPHVAYAEPHYVAQPTWEGVSEPYALNPAHAAFPNDPLFKGRAYMRRLQMTDAWDIVKGQEGDIVIAFIDGGTHWRHPDLKDNIWTNLGEIPANGVDDDQNGFVDDIHGWNFANGTPDPAGLPEQPALARHGTITVGAAAAVTNNALGMAGISWNARIMPINSSCPLTEFIEGICHGAGAALYAAMNGAHIINASYGSYKGSQTESLAFQVAKETGITILASAGNEGYNVDDIAHFPSGYSSTISVGGTRYDSDINEFNFGSSVDVFAAGRNVTATTLGAEYGTGAGTSMATALVSGVAALVKTLHPEYSPEQIREQLRLSADNIDDVNDPSRAGLLGQGRVNALRAVTEFGPDVRASEVSWTDAFSALQRGDLVEITATFAVRRKDAEDLSITLFSDAPYIAFTKASEHLGTVRVGESAQASFAFVLQSDAPYRDQITLMARATSGVHIQEREFLRIDAYPPEVGTQETESLRVTLTSEGNIGYVDYNKSYSAGAALGEGLIVSNAYNTPRNVIMEAGLIVATGPQAVADCVTSQYAYGEDYVQEQDFIPKTGARLQIFSPGNYTTQEGRMELVDTGALGVEILQESFVDESPENEDFVLFKYTVTNPTDRILTNVHVGLYIDWLLNYFYFSGPAYARIDEARQLGYQQNLPTNANLVVGAKLLSGLAPFHYQVFDLRRDIGEEGLLSDAQKWSYLTGGVHIPEDELRDWVQVTGSGPYAIDPYGQIEVAFALVGGMNTEDFLQNADNAQKLWDEKINQAAYAQFIQNVSSTTLDLHVDDALLYDNLEFQSATEFVRFAPGNHKIDVASATNADRLSSETFQLEAGAYHHVIIHGNGEEQRLTLRRDVRTRASSTNMVDLYVVHGARDLETVDLVARYPAGVANPLLANDIEFGDAGPYVSLAPDRYIVEVASASGSRRLDVFQLDLRSVAGKALALNISGTGASSAEGLTLMGVLSSGETFFPPATERAQAQFIQNVADAKIDLYVNDVRVQDDWAFQSATGFDPLPRRSLTMDIVDASATDNAHPLTTVRLDNIERSIIIIYGEQDAPRVALKRRARPEAGSEDRMEVFFVHGAKELPAVDLHALDPLDDARSLALLEDDIAYGKVGSYLPLESTPGGHHIEVRAASGRERIDVFRFEIKHLAGEALVMNLSGSGASSREGLTIMGVRSDGRTFFPSVVTDSPPALELPETFALTGNFPNPFRATTRIRMDLPQAAAVTVEIIDMLGRVVISAPSRDLPPGKDQEIALNTATLPSGAYLYRVRATTPTGQMVDTGSMVHVR